MEGLFEVLNIVGPNGESFSIQKLTEEIVIANAGSTDSTASLLPANSFILGVVGRVTGALLHSRTWQLGTASDPGLFSDAGQLAVKGTTVNSWKKSTPLAPAMNEDASKVTVILSNADGGDGATTKIRVTVFFATLAEPTN